VRRLVSVIVPLAVLAGCGGGAGTPQKSSPSLPAPGATAQAAASGTLRDWPRFGLTAGRSGTTTKATGITAKNVKKLKRRTLAVPGTVDASPIFLRGVRAGAKRRDVVVMTTTYGRTFALDARKGKRVWTFTPKGFSSWAGTAQITNATPAADPGRKAVYAASPDGRIHKLALSNGREVSAGAWPVSITKLPSREKIAPSLSVVGASVLATTGGYIGDADPYQGHVVAISRSAGRITAIFNSLCSERRFVQEPSSCPASDSAIWGRAGAVYDAKAREVYVATGNAPFDGKRHWGDSLLVLSWPGLRLKRNWTPYNQDELNDSDKDLGSTSPALLPSGLVLQGGKDARMDVLSRARPNGRTTTPSAKLGGQKQTLKLPGGAQMMVTAPAVYGSYVFAATDSGTSAYRVSGGGLKRVWSKAEAGTSPIVAGGLLYVYDPSGVLSVYRPKSGQRLRRLPARSGHWNSPIAIAGRVWLPEGDANDHATTGTISVYSLR
jgi:outer membrane protein assembly factor BamB